MMERLKFYRLMNLPFLCCREIILIFSKKKKMILFYFSFSVLEEMNLCIMVGDQVNNRFFLRNEK